ncbi:MAG: type I methionyl aminopeptidase [Candidatus Babeliales bacterium]
MITIKNKKAIEKMAHAGRLLAELFELIPALLKPGMSTGELDAWVAQELIKRQLISQSKGYHGYRHVSCISINDEVVHGIPSFKHYMKDGDLVKVDVCAAWSGYCADMARCFAVGTLPERTCELVLTAQEALDKGIEKAVVGNALSDISAAIQQAVEKKLFGVVRDFAGHGIGKRMHEDPEVLNYGEPGKGPILRAGMTFAIEPMITLGHYDVYVMEDGWTVKTKDRSLAAHVEDTILITDNGPRVLTRLSPVGGS